MLRALVQIFHSGQSQSLTGGAWSESWYCLSALQSGQSQSNIRAFPPDLRALVHILHSGQLQSPRTRARALLPTVGCLRALVHIFNSGQSESPSSYFPLWAEPQMARAPFPWLGPVEKCIYILWKLYCSIWLENELYFLPRTV